MWTGARSVIVIIRTKYKSGTSDRIEPALAKNYVTRFLLQVAEVKATLKTEVCWRDSFSPFHAM